LTTPEHKAKPWTRETGGRSGVPHRVVTPLCAFGKPLQRAGPRAATRRRSLRAHRGTRAGGTAGRCTVHQPSQVLLASETQHTSDRDPLSGQAATLLVERLRRRRDRRRERVLDLQPPAGVLEAGRGDLVRGELALLVILANNVFPVPGKDHPLLVFPAPRLA